MRKFRMICGFALVALMTVTLLTVPRVEAAEQKAQPRVLKFSSFLSPSHFAVPEIRRVLGRLEKASDGEVVIQYYSSEALGKAREQYDIAKEGLADMSLIAQAYNPNIFRLSVITSWPFACESAIVGTYIIQELQKRGLLDKEYTEVQPLQLTVTTPYHIFSNKKLEKVEDFKGLRIVANAPQALQMWKMLGGSGHPIGVADIYTAMQRGTVDAVQTSWTASYSWKFFEVAKYAVDISILGGNSNGIIMNKASYNKLSDKTKKAWDKVWEEEKIYAAKAFMNGDVVGRKTWADLGKLIVFPQAEKEKLAQKVLPIWVDSINDLEKKGYPAREAYKVYVEVMKKHKQPVLIKIPGLYKE